jgi:hypothetical protein
MPGLADLIVRVTSALRTEIVDCPLQWRPTAYVVRPRHPGVTSYHEVPPRVVFATSSRGIVCRSERVNPGWTASRIFAYACQRLIEIIADHRSQDDFSLLQVRWRTFATPHMQRFTYRNTAARGASYDEGYQCCVANRHRAPLPWALEAGSQSDIPKEPGSETLIAATRQHRRFWSAIAGRRIQKSCADG